MTMNVDDLFQACRALNVRPDPLGYITDAQTCALLNLARGTLYGMRDRGEGPMCIQLGGRLRYRLIDIAAWITAAQSQAEQNRAERTVGPLAPLSGCCRTGRRFDHGISGARAREKRSAFDQLWKDAAKGKLDIVAAWSRDRLGRGLQHVVTLLGDLMERSVALYLPYRRKRGR
jgi:predicted DNA-binding transcriptional regulator AlpA